MSKGSPTLVKGTPMGGVYTANEEVDFFVYLLVGGA